MRPFAGPGADGFVGQTLRKGNKQALLLASNQPRGVLFAVYGFLEECLGVRFFGFDGTGEIIPLQPTINPGFARQVSISGDFRHFHFVSR
jgi:hypothetical protein